MKRLCYISLMLILVACTKESFEISNLNGNKIDVLGHAGMGISSTYPINSLESITKALNKGAVGSEFDVQLTKDNVLVAFHDEELDSKTNLEGRIRDLNWSELQEGYYNATPFTRYKIVRVEDILNAFNGDKIFTFDIKINPGTDEDFHTFIDVYTEELVQLFSDHGIHSQCFVESQSVDFISLLQTKDAAIRQFIYPQEFDTGFDIAESLNLYGITISTNNITKEQVQQAHDAGYRVTIWDVYDKSSNRKAVLKNPDMIQTDRVKYLSDYLK